MGKPSDTQKLGEDISGVHLPADVASRCSMRPLDGVAIIYLLTREAGDIRGVRLGDTRQEVGGPAGANLLRWPARWPSTGPGSGGFSSSWAKTTGLSNSAIGRVTDQAPAGAKFYRKNE